MVVDMMDGDGGAAVAEAVGDLIDHRGVGLGADLLGMMSTYFADPSMIHRWLDPYRGAGAEDLAHVARQYLIPENRVTSLFIADRSAA